MALGGIPNSPSSTRPAERLGVDCKTSTTDARCEIGSFGPSVGSSVPANWTNITNGASPSPRWGAALAFDPIDGYTLLFGGASLSSSGLEYDLNDTWTYNHGSWHNISSTVGRAPSPRSGASLVYDAADGYMLLIGGVSESSSGAGCNGALYACGNNSWMYAHGRWTQLDLVNGSLIYQNPYLVAAYDSTAGYVLVYGGGPTYEYKSAAMIQLPNNKTANSSSASPAESLPVLVDDPSAGGVLLIGGEVPNCAMPPDISCPVLSNSTWLYSGDAWTNITSSAGPLPVAALAFAGDYDNGTGEVVVFGCDWSNPHSECDAPAVTLVLAGGIWSNASTLRSPLPVYEGSMTWDAADNASLFFGGLLQYGNPTTCVPCTSNSTWEWTNQPFMVGLSMQASPSPADVDSSVQFISTLKGGTYPLHYSWTFGDGSSSTIASPFHSYARPGTYLVNLTVSDSAAHSLNTSTSIRIVSIGASPSASPNPTDVGLATIFNTGLVGGVGLSNVTWQFGDGTYAHSDSYASSHEYASPGSYTVTMWLNNSGGVHLNTSFVVVVHPALATPQIFAFPSSPSLGELVNFSVNESGGTSPYAYSWSFGDGGTGGNLESITHIFTTNGPFSARVTVSDGAGAVVISTLNLTVALNLSIVGQWDAGASPLAVAYTSQVRGGSFVNSYDWNFGDGGTSTSADPTHVFTTPGFYTTSLTVMDRTGQSAEALWEVYVAPGGGSLNASLAATPAAISNGSSALISGLVTGGSGGYSLTWSSSEGSCEALSALSERCSRIGTGTIAVELEVTDAIGHSVYRSINVTVGISRSESPGSTWQAAFFGTFATQVIGVSIAVAIVTLLLLSNRRLRGPRTSLKPRLNPEYQIRTSSESNPGNSSPQDSEDRNLRTTSSGDDPLRDLI
jgi:PKD repeat protein